VIGLTREDEVRLIPLAQAGDKKSIAEIVRLTIRLVHHIVGRMLKRGCSSSSYEDLVQSGCEGLMRAIYKFDLSKNVKFSSYASWWVKAYALNAFMLEANGQINLTSTASTRKIIFRAAVIRDLRQQGLTIDEIATRTGVDAKTLEVMLPRLLKRDPSLDAQMGYEDDGGTLIELIPSPFVDPVETIDRERRSETVKRAMQKLDRRERDILRHRLAGGNLTVSGLKHGISRERARQIEKESLGKMGRLLRPGSSREPAMSFARAGRKAR